MKKRDTVFIGLMLFALFFGAGNLIFPPYLGMEAGTSFWPAIIGFVITGVSLPILAVVAIALASNGVTSIGSRVHPLFGMIFAATIYLAIGPFFGIPRGASVAYEMGVKPFLTANAGSMSLFVFMTVFFALVFVLSLNPTKLVDRIGQWLTPALLLAIAGLCIAAFLKFDAPLAAPTEKYAEAPFIKGFIEGYLTMDTIAALAFGIIVVKAFADRGVTDKATIVKSTITTGIIAGAGLAAVYVAIAWIGAKIVHTGQFENGGAILTEASQMLFGSAGKGLLGSIVALACLTTCIGLTSATAQYFTERWPAVSYKRFVALLTIVSFMIANLGLTQIISVSVPVLVMIYPFAIVLVLLAFIHPLVENSKFMYVGAVLMTAIFSINDGMQAFGYPIEALQQAISWVPLYSSGLGWLLPAMVGGLAGFAVDRVTKPYSKTVHSMDS
ncbi:LIVCS family branched-chain amino acid:cation transporter [Bacillus ectoiniformans]|uniref:branched-chain amino acid transport system II carrier protein n=1 Tax=Bacillus ectoiniformans TaxID=1494429 RepID=UPI001956EECC|nr:branched-chain amino acid transport system II carrier protein [Bacillus ectoiniformans]MBM7647730.1 LIVCS family branched-chain amino acid:cation transporter [Bacillus ectoiniformans]